MRHDAAPPDVCALRVRERLRERARALARVPTPDVPLEVVDVVIFAVGEERFALPSHHVLDVFRVSTLALLPPAAAPLVAITEWQGDLLTLLDLRGALGYVTASLSDRTVGLTLGADQPTLGILVDRVIEHRPLPSAAVAPAPAGTDHSRRLVRGITSDAVLLLDGEALLASCGSRPIDRTSRP
jgi:purine-binding chemotaxis protein CheW